MRWVAAGIYISRAYTGLGPPTTHGSGASRFVRKYVQVQVCTYMHAVSTLSGMMYSLVLEIYMWR